MVAPQSTTDDRRFGPIGYAYGEDGILREYVLNGVILLNPDGSNPTGGLPASGVTPVSGTFATATQSGTFTPLAGRDFNVYLATTANTVQLERQRNGVDWEVVLTPALIAALPPSFTWSEPQNGVPYRLNCTTYSASQAYGISQ